MDDDVARVVRPAGGVVEVDAFYWMRDAGHGVYAVGVDEVLARDSVADGGAGLEIGIVTTVGIILVVGSIARAIGKHSASW